MAFDIPDACALPTAERPVRLAEFDEVFATAVRDVEGVVSAYRFPSTAGTDGAVLSCDLAADGGEAPDRIGVWQRTPSRALRREALPGPADGDGTGVVLWFPFDVELAATLAGLAAAEYRCCSVGSYAVIVDGAGLRPEVRMPAGAADAVAAVVGRPDTDAAPAVTR